MISVPEFMQGMRAVIAAGAAGLKDNCRAALWGFAPLRVAATIPRARARIDRLIVEDHHFPQGRPGTPKRVFLDPPVSSRFAEISAPTLVVVGDGEMPALAEQGALMARGIPEAQLSVIEGAGHIVNIEQPEAYTEIVLSGFGRISGPPADAGTMTTWTRLGWTYGCGRSGSTRAVQRQLPPAVAGTSV